MFKTNSNIDNGYSEMSILGKLGCIGKNEISYGSKYNEIKDVFVAINQNGVVAIGCKLIVYNDRLIETKQFAVSVYEDNKLKISETLDKYKSDYDGICLDSEKLFLFSNNQLLVKTVTNVMKLYDLKDLKYLKSKSFDYKIKNIQIFENKILLTNESSDVPFIFDENLNLLGKLQLEITNPLYSFERIVISRDKIFAERKRKFFQKKTNDHKTLIEVHNENDGLFHSRLNIEDSFEMVSVVTDSYTGYRNWLQPPPLAPSLS